MLQIHWKMLVAVAAFVFLGEVREGILGVVVELVCITFAGCHPFTKLVI